MVLIILAAVAAFLILFSALPNAPAWPLPAACFLLALGLFLIGYGAVGKL